MLERRKEGGRVQKGKYQEKKEEWRREEEKGGRGQERKEAQKKKESDVEEGRQGGRHRRRMEKSGALALTLSLSPLLHRPLRGSIDNWAWDSCQSLRVKSR